MNGLVDAGARRLGLNGNARCRMCDGEWHAIVVRPHDFGPGVLESEPTIVLSVNAVARERFMRHCRWACGRS